jgi:DNA-binding transcriptional MerR regulator
MRVSEVASAAEVSVQTLRYYERRGLFRIVPQRSATGHREYDSDTVQRVRFIRKAQDVGFTLEEIRELLELRDRRPSPEQVRKLASAKVKDLNDRLQYLTAIRDLLVGMIDECACSKTSGDCPIIDALERAP